jgi:hypothetical protein
MTNEVELKERDDNSGNGGHHDDDRAKTFEITIVYNGLTKPLTVEKTELVSAVLARAIALFGTLPQPHTLALYTEDRGELPDGQTMKEAGIKKREKVLLRPSTVKAG